MHVGVHPCQRRRAARDVAARRQQRGHRGVSRATGDVARPGHAARGRVENPAREIAGVDVLQREVGGTRRQNLAAAVHAQQPPRQPADVFTRPEDQSRPGKQRPVAERRLDRELRPAFDRRVVAVVRVGRPLDGRRRLIAADERRRRVDRDAGHVHVTTRAICERSGAVAGRARCPCPRVDDDVPIPPGEHRQVLRSQSVADQALDALVDAGSVPVEGRDRPVTTQAVFDDGATDERRPSENEQPHASTVSARDSSSPVRGDNEERPHFHGASRRIGETGFEPATARPPAGCATRLRHSP